MDTDKLNPGDPVQPCHDDPTLRVRNAQNSVAGTELTQSVGYTSRGYVSHFLPDREVNLAQLNKSLADVFGEPALRMMRMNLEIDRDYWMQMCGNPWSGNIYQYSFASPDIPPIDLESLQDQLRKIQADIDELKQRPG
jgi:hypothetical protein